jgi:type I restriction enzyme S subunit
VSSILEVIPKNWVLTSLGEITAPSAEKIEPAACANSAYVSLEHIEAHSGHLLSVGRGSDIRSTKSVFRAGDVLYGKLRPYLNKVAIPDFDGVCSTDILVFRPSRDLHNRFLYHLLRQHSVVEYAVRHASGINLPRVSFNALAELPVALPPLSEQRRIAERIDALRTRSHASREQIQLLPRLVQNYRQSLLAAAFRGDLTADWRAQNPNVEPASIFLERKIKLLQQTGNNKEEVSLATTQLAPLPHGWAWVQLALLGENTTNPVQTGPFGAQLHNSEFTSAGVPVIAVGNLTGFGFSKRGLYYVSPRKAAQLSRYDVQAGDLLFARSGATLGKVCIAPEYVRDWRMTGHILRVRLDRTAVIPELVAYALRGCPAVQEYVVSQIRGMTRPGYNTSLLASVPIPVPPRAEQQVLNDRLTAQMRRIDDLIEFVRGIQRELDVLDQSIVTKAFRGELVPQDPNDEPASVLLERIRAERAAEGGGKPRRGRRKASA